MTGDAFDIKIDPGNGQEPRPIFKVDPSWITSRKSFFDMQGNHLFDLKKEHFHFVHQHMKLVDKDGNKFCEVKKNLKREFIPGMTSHTFVCRCYAEHEQVGFGSKYTVTMSSPNAGDQVLIMEGNWRDSIAQVKHEASGQVIAEVRRKSAFKSLSTFLWAQQTYMLTVAPGVDYAALAAVAIVFDECENDGPV